MSFTKQTLRTTTALAIAGTLLLAGCAAEEPVAKDPSPAPSTSPSETPPAEETPAPPSFDKSAQSIDDPNSTWVVSNKLRTLNPLEYAPDDLVMPEGVENQFAQPLREPAARAAEQMLTAATDAGMSVWIISAYRDYATQVALYDRYVERDGADAADRYSARPGHSEHQTGLVIDLDDHGDCYLDRCFGETETGKWLAEHAADYGFVMRYPDGKEPVTGFVYEPWHFRYVGVELAQEMRAEGVSTLEEFFELPPAPDYAD